MSESKDTANTVLRENSSQKPFVVSGVYENSEISTMQAIAPSAGISILALTKEGRKYEIQWEDKKTGGYGIDTNTVPKGCSYIKMSCPQDNFQEFLDAVQTAEKAKQPPPESL